MELKVLDEAVSEALIQMIAQSVVLTELFPKSFVQNCGKPSTRVSGYDMVCLDEPRQDRLGHLRDMMI